MPKTRRVQTSFTSGELDPNLVVRSDLEQFYDGAAELTNVELLTTGGYKRRPGLAYIAETPNARMAEFQFNDQQKYLFVFTAGQLDVYGVPDNTLLDTVAIASLTEGMLPSLNWTQSADTFILTHPDLETLQITRTGATTFTVSTFPYANIPVYAFSGVTTTAGTGTATPTDATGTITITTTVSQFTAATEKQFIAINDGLVRVDTYVSGTEVQGFVVIELRDTSAASAGDWEIESGYEDVISASRGWPITATFHEGRLYFCGLKSRPQTVLGSKVGDFFNFDTGTAADDDAIDATINADQLNYINGVKSGRNLQLFTAGGEFYVPKSSTQVAITPTNISFVRSTNHGSPTNIRPVSVDGSTLFYDGKDTREFIFNDIEQSYVAPSMNLLSTHILNSVVDIDLRRTTSASNASYMYAVNGDGTLSVLNTLRSQKITAWVKWTTEGDFKDVCVVGDDVYFVVYRRISGVDRYFIETIDQSKKLDSSVAIGSGTAQTVWTGFSHLDGETVQTFADNFYVGDVVPSSGSVTLSDESNSIEVGYSYFCKSVTMPLDGVFFGEASTAKRKRLVRAFVRVKNTRAMIVNGFRPPLRKISALFDGQPYLEDDWIEVCLNGYDRYAQLTITQDTPTEMTILGVVLEFRVNVR